MSGHSKWSNIKHKKEKTDAQKAKVFTKIGKEITIAVKESGLHTILVQRMNANGGEISSTTVYKSLSYSKEYDAFADTDAALALTENLTSSSNGYIITDPLQVFDNAVEYLHIIIDPRIPFAIIIIVCFLIDIIVRKFKWKWPHEIIRDKKRTANASK